MYTLYIQGESSILPPPNKQSQVWGGVVGLFLNPMSGTLFFWGVARRMTHPVRPSCRKPGINSVICHYSSYLTCSWRKSRRAGRCRRLCAIERLQEGGGQKIELQCNYILYISMLFSPIGLTPRLAYSVRTDRIGYNVGVSPTNRASLQLVQLLLNTAVFHYLVERCK